MQLFCVIFLHPLHRNSFRAKKKLKKSVKKFGLYSFLHYLYTIRKINKSNNNLKQKQNEKFKQNKNEIKKNFKRVSN